LAQATSDASTAAMPGPQRQCVDPIARVSVGERYDPAVDPATR
jgi:hypothetical protein